MSDVVNPLEKVVREAQAQGPVAEPSSLLGALASLENPIAGLADGDQTTSLIEAIHNEFPIIRNARRTRDALDPSDTSQWASLIRWFLLELRQWQYAQDPRLHKLTAIFLVAQASDWDNRLWSLVPEEFANNPELIQCLKALIKTFQVSTTVPASSAPIWEREVAEKFKVADAAGDWVEITIGLKSFEHRLLPQSLLVQSIRCLYRCGTNHLVDALADLRQTIVALQVANALSVDQCLDLSVASDNPYIQFASMHRTFSGRQQKLSPSEQQLATTLLLKVASDGPRWRAWMRVFNAYPVRYPSLQVPLGHALAEVPEAAIESYVNEVVLLVKPALLDPGRQIVADCLRAFRAKADPQRRNLLWSRVYHRWSTWNFGQANSNPHLFLIACSDFDYGVVAFACECMKDINRTKTINDIREELQTLDDKWYASATDILTAWNRLVSRFQPYAHASQVVASGEDWLNEANPYLPFDPSKNEYLMMKYKLT